MAFLRPCVQKRWPHRDFGFLWEFSDSENGEGEKKEEICAMVVETICHPHGETLPRWVQAGQNTQFFKCLYYKYASFNQMRSKFGTVICCFHGLYLMRNAVTLGGKSGNGDRESTFCRCVQATRQRKVWNEVCTWERSPRAASGCPFPSRSNKAFRRPHSSSQYASVAEIAGLLPAFSDVFAVFLSKGSAVRTCQFCFFSLHSYLIGRSVGCTERGGGGGREASRRRLCRPRGSTSRNVTQTLCQRGTAHCGASKGWTLRQWSESTL